MHALVAILVADVDDFDRVVAHRARVVAMIRCPPGQPDTRLSRSLIVVAFGVVGAAAVLGLQAPAFVAQAMDIAWLRHVAANAGPVAVVGGAAAGAGAAVGGSGGPAGFGDPWVPFKTKMYDPSTGTSRDPSLYERIIWEVDRRLSGRASDEERYNKIMGDENFRSQYRNEQMNTMPPDPHAEPTAPHGEPGRPDRRASPGGSGSVQPVADPPEPEPGTAHRDLDQPRARAGSGSRRAAGEWAAMDEDRALRRPCQPGQATSPAGSPPIIAARWPCSRPASIRATEARANAAAMRALVADCGHGHGALSRARRGRRRAFGRAPRGARQAARPRAHRAAARPGRAVPGAEPARRERACTTTRRPARASSPASAGQRHGVRDRRQRRDGQGRHLLPDDGEEAPARAGDRAGRTGCRASTWSTPAARSCRSRTRSSPTATTSAASSTTRRRCRRAASRRSRW